MAKKISFGACSVIAVLTLVLGLGFFNLKTAHADDAAAALVKFFDRDREVSVTMTVTVGLTVGQQGLVIPDIADYIDEYPEGTGPEAGLIDGQDYKHTPPKWYVGDKEFNSDTIITSEIISSGTIRVNSRFFSNQYWVTIIYDNGQQARKLVTYGGTVEIPAPPQGLAFGQYLSFDNDETVNITGPRQIIVHVETFVWYVLGAMLLAAFVAGAWLLLANKKEEKLIKRDEALRERLLIAAKNQDARIGKLQSKRFVREEQAAKKLAEEAEARRRATEISDGFPKI